MSFSQSAPRISLGRWLGLVRLWALCPGAHVEQAIFFYHTSRTTTMLQKINLAEAFGRITSHWTPVVVGELNGQQVKLATLKGEFLWHHHEQEDELFLVLKGTLLMRLRDRDVLIHAGEFFIVPRGVEHLPIAEQEVHLLLFEPASTVR